MDFESEMEMEEDKEMDGRIGSGDPQCTRNGSRELYT